MREEDIIRLFAKLRRKLSSSVGKRLIPPSREFLKNVYKIDDYSDKIEQKNNKNALPK